MDKNSSGVSTSQPRGLAGRYLPRYDLRSLIEVVAAVARTADPARPQTVSQRAYDAARVKSGYPQAPPAQRTAARFNLPWRELLALALDEKKGHDWAIGKRYGEEERPELTEEAVRAALRTIALRLDQRTLTPADYSGEREKMRAKARLSWRYDRDPRLPSEGQIVWVAGSWDAALAIAGLELRPPDPGGAKGLSRAEVLDLALDATGCLLTSHELNTFAAANGLSLEKWKKGTTSWADELTALREMRAEWGKWTPAAPPPKEHRPDYSIPSSWLGRDAGPRRRKQRWTRDECVVAIRQVMAENPGRSLTLHAYQRAASGRLELPAVLAIQRWAPWSEMVAEARALSSRAPAEGSNNLPARPLTPPPAGAQRR